MPFTICPPTTYPPFFVGKTPLQLGFVFFLSSVLKADCTLDFSSPPGRLFPRVLILSPFSLHPHPPSRVVYTPWRRSHQFTFPPPCVFCARASPFFFSVIQWPRNRWFLLRFLTPKERALVLLVLSGFCLDSSSEPGSLFRASPFVCPPQATHPGGPQSGGSVSELIPAVIFPYRLVTPLIPFSRFLRASFFFKWFFPLSLRPH